MSLSFLPSGSWHLAAACSVATTLLWANPCVANAEPPTIVSAAASALRAAMPAYVTAVELAPVATPRAWTCSNGIEPHGYTVTPPSLAGVSARHRVDVEALCAEGKRHWPIWFSVRAQGQVVVTQRALRAGEPLAGATMVERVELSSVQGVPFASIAEVEAFRLRVPVAAGAVLHGGHVEAMPDVVRGQNVVAALRSGVVKLTFNAIAEADGFIGANTKIVRGAGHELLNARVTGPGFVEVLQ